MQIILRRYGKLFQNVVHITSKFVKSMNKQDECIKKKWVTNISQRVLSKNEISLLRKGLNFAVTPKSVPTKGTLASVEQGIIGLSENEKAEVRGKIYYSTLKDAKPPIKQNLSRGERKAMKDLKFDANIIVIKADRGNSTVVMDKASYSNQIREMLRDEDIYKRIVDKRRNSTTKVESEMQTPC